jgi:long-chain fatty acid transport protein
MAKSLMPNFCKRACASLGAMLLLGSALAPVSALASGFEIPGNTAAGLGRGNAWTVGVNDASALAHNPGALSRIKGTRIFLNHQTVWDQAKFTRAKSGITQTNVTATSAAEAQKPVENASNPFALGAMFVATSDFGLEDWTFAVGGYGPSAVGQRKFPVQGGQRYMLTELDSIVAYLSAAAAYGKKDHYGIGVTLQVATMERTNMSLVVDAATGGSLNPYYGTNDVEATVQMDDPLAFSAIVGGWLRLNDNIELALSSRVMPVSFQAEGTVGIRNAPGGATFTDVQLSMTDPKASMKLNLAPTIAAGVRYRGLADDGKGGQKEKWDVELNAVYEMWSVLKAFDVKMSGQINLFAATEMPDVYIAKNWKDTLSLRLGGTYWVNDQLGLSAGTYVEQGATPEGYEHLDFSSFDRLGVGLGARWNTERVQIAVGYNHVFSESRVVDELNGKVYQTRPLDGCPLNVQGEKCDSGKGWSGVPSNAGTFDQGYDLVSASVGWKF